MNNISVCKLGKSKETRTNIFCLSLIVFTCKNRKSKETVDFSKMAGDSDEEDDKTKQRGANIKQQQQQQQSQQQQAGVKTIMTDQGAANGNKIVLEAVADPVAAFEEVRRQFFFFFLCKHHSRLSIFFILLALGNILRFNTAQ